MPSWRKVIVSGSDATLNSVTTPIGTINSMTSSFAMTASSTTAVAGTTNYVSKFTSGTTIGNSQIFDNGTNLGIGTTSPGNKLTIQGNISLRNSSGFDRTILGIDGITSSPYMTLMRESDTTITVRLDSNGDSYFTGGNVGIGTTSLSAKLTVTKGAQSDTVSVANSAAYLYGADVGLIIGQYASGPYGTWLQSIRADNVTFPLSLQPSGGNVGIGTSNPITKLHVAINDNTFAGAALLENTNSGTSALSTISFKTANNASTFAVGQVNNGGGAILYNGANTSMTFSTNASPRMTIAAGGNVGINESSPSSNLQVQSNNLTAPAFAVSKSFSGGGDGTAVMHAFGYDSGIGNTGIQVGVKGTGGFSATDAYPFRVFNGGTSILDVKSNSGIRLNSYGSGTFTGTAAYTLAVDSSGNIIETTGGGGSGTVNSGTSGYLAYYPSTGTTIDDTSGVYWDSSNSRLGIGTSSPGNKLSIVTGPGADDVIPALGNNGGKFSLLNNGGLYGLIGGVLGTGNGYLQVQRVDGGATAYNLLLQPNGGNVGIGTITPSFPLEVSGAIVSSGGGTFGTGGTYGFGFTGTSLTGDGLVGYVAVNTGGSEKMRVTISGNVGIGTSSPNAKLDVNGNTLITGSLRVTAGITGSLNGNADTATSVAWTDSATSTFAIAMSDGTTAYYDAAGDLRWDGGSKVISVTDGAETLSLNGKYIVQTGTGLLNYYADRHVFGDNAFNYQGQLIGGSFDAALDITCGGTKFFDIPHQSKSGWGLKHGAIEGPESAVYFRGKLEADNIIQFPAYWEWLVHSETITVSLTPVGSFQPLYVEKIENNQAVIASNGEPINCHFVVYAERKDVARWDVEYPGYSRGNISDSE
jgi:hypothetical protein